jgi:MYXO-CTERM domain-containing protein
VHLQYRRWLNVEDSFFDKGSIYANDMLAWRNLDSDQGNSSSTHHQDGEWRFHDVPLSSYISGNTVKIKYEIDSDQGLELGGWTIDDFCIVAISGSVCGDGEITGNEECDDGAGNGLDPDACRTTCRFPTCGDGVVDSSETCDDGNGINDDECTNACDGAFGADGGGGCGCETTGNLPPASGILLLGAVIVLLRRRRRHDV